MDIIYLPGYNMALAQILMRRCRSLVEYSLSGPREASGTSGMKAALNGVPSLSGPGWVVAGRSKWRE